jgi:acetyl-CoA acetyltransferase
MNRQGLRGRSAIVGVAESPMVRDTERNLREIVIGAVLGALEDAGLSPKDVDGIITDDEISQVGMTGSEVVGALGLQRSFMVQAPSAGAGYAYAPLLAAMALEAGEASVVLCFLGLEFGREQPGAATFAYLNEGSDRQAFEYPFGFAGTPVYYAMVAQRYRALYGLKDEQLGALAVSIRNHGARHPGAQRPEPVTMADYLASPYVAEPLRLLDCCLRTTAAAAFVLTSPDRARSLRRPAVLMLGAGYAASAVSRRHFWTQRPEFPATMTSVAARRAYEMAGIGPADVDFAELQDPYTIAALMQIESCGFCGEGEAASFVEGGQVSVGGRLPVNTHGGQLSHGYMMSVTHIVEAVRQLRREAPANPVNGASIGLVSGLGPGDCGVLLLGRDA